ncbi:unnamed protein product [Penicillium salamii]|nr:unnamed protein product [Penicillium salamii]
MSLSQKRPSSPSSAPLGVPEPVNSTVLHRCWTLLAIKILTRIRPREGSVLMLTDRLYVKYEKRIHLSEASRMQFISQYTTIPVPKVFCAFTSSGCTYIVMERIKGDIIGNGRVRRSEESKAKLLSRLAANIRKMRDLQPPEGSKIASVDGKSLFDCRI